MEHPDQLIETNSMFAMFKCSICKLLLENPQSLRRCGHTFCFGCINRALSIRRRCPECRKDVSEIDVNPNHHLCRMVKSLQRKCEFHELGCKWSTTVTEVDAITNHERKCRFVKRKIELVCIY